MLKNLKTSTLVIAAIIVLSGQQAYSAENIVFSGSQLQLQAPQSAPVTGLTSFFVTLPSDLVNFLANPGGLTNVCNIFSPTLTYSSPDATNRTITYATLLLAISENRDVTIRVDKNFTGSSSGNCFVVFVRL